MARPLVRGRNGLMVSAAYLAGRSCNACDLPKPTPPVADGPLTLRIQWEEDSPPYTITGDELTIDWGDGTVGPGPHTYAEPGEYVIKVQGGAGNIIEAGHPSLIEVVSFGTDQVTGVIFGTEEDMETRISPNLVTVPDILPSYFTTMASMFLGASSFNYDISGWNTSAVTSMSFTFGLAETFNQDISGWNTSAVEDMSFTFYNTPAFNQDIGGWITSAVKTMASMFLEASSFNYDISGWNTSAVTSMASMFAGALAFNQDISGWNTSAVEDMSFTFRNATSFNQDLSRWCVSLIPSTPSGFDTDATAWVLPKPIWGTCPA